MNNRRIALGLTIGATALAFGLSSISLPSVALALSLACLLTVTLLAGQLLLVWQHRPFLVTLPGFALLTLIFILLFIGVEAGGQATTQPATPIVALRGVASLWILAGLLPYLLTATLFLWATDQGLTAAGVVFLLLTWGIALYIVRAGANAFLASVIGGQLPLALNGLLCLSLLFLPAGVITFVLRTLTLFTREMREKPAYMSAAGPIQQNG